ncbi:flagellin [Candidatus Campylobacter infans]|uniref:Flagellin n=1 Tax=Candidatus Campylobacter infans TaxID=2561898 RepID=A0A7H9CLD4_9BACT|nr:flagellin B [Candidatus Campylobacter infans]QLI06018.1 flagellin [Candidatus Campylobacter infans]
MGFRINTNISAMNAYVNSSSTSRALDESISKLSSGLRINKAADDASGMTIADSLKAQASALGQAIANGNDAIGIVQTADKAMDEQLSILNTIRTKAVQAAQDGQTSQSREALQSDISRLLEELDNIATTTSFNGQQLLNGNFSNKNFQIGAYANQTVQVSIGATASDKIGLTRFETSQLMAYSDGGIKDIVLKLSGIDGYPSGYEFQTISSTEFEKYGLKAVADRINGVSDLTGVSAKVLNSITFSNVVAAGDIKGLQINGIGIGDVTTVAGDKNNVLVNAINKVKEQTGVEASTKDGKLTLTARDGRAITIKSTQSQANSQLGTGKAGFSVGTTIVGKLTLIRQDARDIVFRMSGCEEVKAISLGAEIITGEMSVAVGTGVTQKTVSLGDMNSGILDKDLAAAMGYFAGGISKTDQLSGVTTYYGAQAMISISESAQKILDRIRSDLGSVQNQLQSTINNISVTQVNVKSAESQIRDVDFATEASNFNKYNILAQSGSYAMSQANTIQQNVMRLLQ